MQKKNNVFPHVPHVPHVPHNLLHFPQIAITSHALKHFSPMNFFNVKCLYLNLISQRNPKLYLSVA